MFHSFRIWTEKNKAHLDSSDLVLYINCIDHSFLLFLRHKTRNRIFAFQSAETFPVLKQLRAPWPPNSWFSLLLLFSLLFFLWVLAPTRLEWGLLNTKKLLLHSVKSDSNPNASALRKWSTAWRETAERSLMYARASEIRNAAEPWGNVRKLATRNGALVRSNVFRLANVHARTAFARSQIEGQAL